MIAVVQRVFSAAVTANGDPAGKIGQGLLVLLGVRKEDTEEDAAVLAGKIARLRIFSDENDKMNLSVTDVGGGVLVVSNFTLCANYAHGNRPDYLAAAEPARADALYRHFVGQMRQAVSPVETGVFGAHMEISMAANGPITIVMDSAVLRKKNGQGTV